MSNIIACYKWVVDETDIKVDADLSVDFSKAKGKISDYDRNAIEEAVKLAEKLGGKAIGLTFGNRKTKQSLKDALSRGLAEAVWVKDEGAELVDNVVTAKALAAGVTTVSDVSLIICADGASDTYARQTAPRVAALLDLPVITSVCEMDIEGNILTAVRKLDDCLETVSVELPAIVSVLPEINQPSIPGLKAVMAAGKKPVKEIEALDLGVDMSVKRNDVEVKAYSQERKNIIIDGEDSSSQVAELITYLKKEGVL